MNNKQNENNYDKRYEKIINLPHHQSKKRRHMTMTERAAQFGAFRALTGYEDEILETARYTDEKIELDEYTKVDIDSKLRYMKEHISDRCEVSITYFVKDKIKEGGSYITKKGIVCKIKAYEKTLVFDDKTEVFIDDIVCIEGNVFNDNCRSSV